MTGMFTRTFLCYRQVTHVEYCTPFGAISPNVAATSETVGSKRPGYDATMPHGHPSPLL